MFLADYHVHTAFSDDAQGSMAAHVRAAVDRGITELCFTDHTDDCCIGEVLSCVHRPYTRWMENARAQFTALQEKYAGQITLRFGHETMVLPLTCLLGINGYDSQISSLDSLESKGWINYKVFPMGANIQLVFYRRNRNDKDVLVKVLLNENEATLPVKTDCAPYYRWSDFKKYYLDKLDTYKN